MKVTDKEFADVVRGIVVPLIKESMGGADGKSVADVVEAQIKKSFENKDLFPSWLQKISDDGVKPKDKKERVKGQAAGRVIRACVNASLKKGNAETVAKQLKDWGDEDLADIYTKAAMSVSDPTAGGFLVPEQFSTDVIEFLRPQSVVRDLIGGTIPMPTGTLSIPKITQGSTAYYQGENAAATKSALQTGQIKLTWRKLTALVPMSNDLIRYSSPNADTIVRNDMVRSIAQRENQAFLRDNGTDSSPKGLRYLAANAASPLAATVSYSLTTATANMGLMILDLMNDNIPMTRCGWIFAPRTYMYLYTVRDGNGNFAFRDEMSRGMFWGYPFRISTQVPINLTDHGGTTESEIYFADFDDVVLGDSMALRVDASDVASYSDGGTTVSAFQNDQTVVRAITEHDLNARRAESISIMNGVLWTP